MNTDDITIKSEPLVTILIQIFNRKDLLRKAIESAINQTYKNIEIFIADNHSEDGTEGMVIDYCKNELRIKYHRHEQNIGMIKNAEYSMRRSQGDYLVHLNDDDWLDLDYVEHSVKFLEQNPDYAFVSPQTRLYSREDSSAEPRLMYAPKLDDEKVISRLKKYVASQDTGMISSGCFRASIIRDCLMADNFTYKK